MLNKYIKKTICTIFALFLVAVMALTSFAEECEVESGDMGSEEMDSLYFSEQYQKYLDEWMKQQDSRPTARIGGNKKLNVTNWQQSNKSGCGPACVYQIGKYLGFTDMGSLETLTNSMTDNGTHGTDLSTQLMPYLNERINNDDYVLLKVQDVDFLSRLVSSIDKNRPLICHVVPGKLPNNPFGNYSGGHYVVAIGYNWFMQGSAGYSNVTYNDPHHNSEVYGEHTCSTEMMTDAIRARNGYYIAA